MGRRWWGPVVCGCLGRVVEVQGWLGAIGVQGWVGWSPGVGRGGVGPGVVGGE